MRRRRFEGTIPPVPVCACMSIPAEIFGNHKWNGCAAYDCKPGDRWLISAWWQSSTSLCALSPRASKLTMGSHPCCGAVGGREMDIELECLSTKRCCSVGRAAPWNCLYLCGSCLPAPEHAIVLCGGCVWWGSRRSGYQAMVIVRSRTMVAQCGREEDGPCHWAVGIGSSGVSRGRVFTSRMGVV